MGHFSLMEGVISGMGAIDTASYGKKIPGRHLLLRRPSTRLSD
jgi:hypothetical protein